MTSAPRRRISASVSPHHSSSARATTSFVRPNACRGTVGTGDLGGDDRGLRRPRPGVGAPCRDDAAGAIECAVDRPSVVLVAERQLAEHLRSARQVARVGRSPRVEVDDADAAGAPTAREADASPDGRVVLLGVCRGRVEHHEQHRRLDIPRPPEQVAVALVVGDVRAALSVAEQRQLAHPLRRTRRGHPFAPSSASARSARL